MKALTTKSYKRGFLALGSETPRAKTWAWALAYESNIKFFDGLKWNYFVAKKGNILNEPLHFNEEHQNFKRKHTWMSLRIHHIIETWKPYLFSFVMDVRRSMRPCKNQICFELELGIVMCRWPTFDGKTSLEVP